MDSSNNNILESYENDLSQPLPERLDSLLPPFNTEDPTELKLSNILRSLHRSIRMNNRINALTCAFFLGSLLEEIKATPEKKKVQGKITLYYRQMAQRVYDIFETNPSHILYTTIIKAQEIRKLRKSEILHLTNVVQNSYFSSIFDGAQNLEEENC
jgi:hypothetical protein